VRSIERRLAAGRSASANDPNDVIVSLRPDHEHEPPADRADRDEAVLVIGMFVVEDLENARVRHEELARFFERNPVFLSVAAFFARSQTTFTDPV
jgi:hypothetical protein